MALSDQPLIELMEPYPHLRHALGPQWIAVQDRVDPIQSRFPLARWLRVDGFQADLSTIDIVLQQLEGVPGIADRRRRIRSNAPALMETLTELYFGAWLLDEGFSFDLPDEGADFNVHLGENQSLAIEATTPRIAQWAQDLFERLHLVALRTGHSGSVEHQLETLADTSLSIKIVNTIVMEALDALAPTNPNTAGMDLDVTQDYPNYGMKITWTPSVRPGIAAMTSPKTTSPYTFFYRLVSAARKKAEQLSPDQAGVLLVGTQHLPVTELWSFENAIRHYPLENMQFDWTKLPNQIKHVILYYLQLKRIKPFQAIWIVNPASSLPDPPEARQFLQALFPSPLRSDHDSDDLRN